VGAHRFLSDPWVTAARRIHEEYRGRTPTVTQAVQVNLVLTDVPFGTGRVDAHVDTTAGELEIDLGHRSEPDVTLTLRYDTAKAIFVDGDTTAAMKAFVSGQIDVQGDVTKLLALQGQLATADPVAAELAARIRAVTA
jgi:putative sterol carrier protein